MFSSTWILILVRIIWTKPDSTDTDHYSEARRTQNFFFVPGCMRRRKKVLDFIIKFFLCTIKFINEKRKKNPDDTMSRLYSSVYSLFETIRKLLLDLMKLHANKKNLCTHRAELYVRVFRVHLKSWSHVNWILERQCTTYVHLHQAELSFDCCRKCFEVSYWLRTTPY